MIERQTKYLSKVLTLEPMRTREQRQAFSSLLKDGDPDLYLPCLAGVSCVYEKTAWLSWSLFLPLGDEGDRVSRTGAAIWVLSTASYTQIFLPCLLLFHPSCTSGQNKDFVQAIVPEVVLEVRTLWKILIIKELQLFFFQQPFPPFGKITPLYWEVSISSLHVSLTRLLIQCHPGLHSARPQTLDLWLDQSWTHD